ncbi:MAG: hypothetical protein ACE5K0_12490 [Candidatus Methanofastidiosia archaeon]
MSFRDRDLLEKMVQEYALRDLEIRSEIQSLIEFRRGFSEKRNSI